MHYRVFDVGDLSEDAVEGLYYRGDEGFVIEIDGVFDAEFGEDEEAAWQYACWELDVPRDEFVPAYFADEWGRRGMVAER